MVLQEGARFLFVRFRRVQNIIQRSYLIQLSSESFIFRHRKKRMKQIQKAIARGMYDPNKDDPFELFISSTTIRWTFYKDSHKILGNTYGMCVLQVRFLFNISFFISICGLASGHPLFPLRILP